jgi:hypothetical protein
MLLQAAPNKKWGLLFGAAAAAAAERGAAAAAAAIYSAHELARERCGGGGFARARALVFFCVFVGGVCVCVVGWLLALLFLPHSTRPGRVCVCVQKGCRPGRSAHTAL